MDGKTTDQPVKRQKRKQHELQSKTITKKVSFHFILILYKWLIICTEKCATMHIFLCKLIDPFQY